MTDDPQEIGKLHQHLDHISNQVRDVKHGQDQLHKEHLALRDRVDHLEVRVTNDIANLDKHEAEATIYRSHLMEGFDRLSDLVDRLYHRFEQHDEEDREERKKVIDGQRKTILSIILAALTFFSTGAVLMWQTGVLQ